MLTVEGKSEVYKPDKGSVTDLRSRNNSGESCEKGMEMKFLYYIHTHMSCKKELWCSMVFNIKIVYF